MAKKSETSELFDRAKMIFDKNYRSIVGKVLKEYGLETAIAALAICEKEFDPIRYSDAVALYMHILRNKFTPLPKEIKPYDPNKELWDRGIALLGIGKSKQAFIGKIKKQYGSQAVLEAIQAAESNNISQESAIAFIQGCLNYKYGSSENAQRSPRSIIHNKLKDIIGGPGTKATRTQRWIDRIYIPAKRLRLPCSEQMLAQILLDFYLWVKDEQAKYVTFDDIRNFTPIPDEFVGNYIFWLLDAEQDWIKVGWNTFHPDSQIVYQYRREVASLDWDKRDPINPQIKYWPNQ